MPRALEPGGTFPVVLDIDETKPADKQPKFHSKYLSGREQRAMLALSDKLQDAETNVEALDIVFESLGIAFVGWDHMVDPRTGQAIEFDPSKFIDILGVNEALELLRKARQGNNLSVTDLGNLGSPPSSEPGSSAESAAPADASTAQPNGSLSSSSAPSVPSAAATNATRQAASS